VTDSGAGIVRDMLPKVFDLFTRGDRQLDRTSAGLGIGLALVHRLVAMHGGSVTATSQGQGPARRSPSVFLFSRRRSAPSRRRSCTRRHREDPRVAVPRARRRRQRDAALTMALMLRMSGHEVETAEDGLQALEIASVFSPQIVLLDLGMPKLNGYETAKRIREAPWGHNVSLIALTGWGQPKDRQRTLEAGFNAHLVKPVGSTELMEVISRVATPNARASALN
jgi:CheY-like chemotaxis protein